MKSQSMSSLPEAQCHLFPNSWAAEANNFSPRAANLEQYMQDVMFSIFNRCIENGTGY